MTQQDNNRKIFWFSLSFSVEQFSFPATDNVALTAENVAQFASQIAESEVESLELDDMALLLGHGDTEEFNKSLYSFMLIFMEDVSQKSGDQIKEFASNFADLFRKEDIINRSIAHSIQKDMECDALCDEVKSKLPYITIVLKVDSMIYLAYFITYREMYEKYTGKSFDDLVVLHQLIHQKAMSSMQA